MNELRLTPEQEAAEQRLYEAANGSACTCPNCAAHSGNRRERRARTYARSQR